MVRLLALVWRAGLRGLVFLRERHLLGVKPGVRHGLAQGVLSDGLIVMQGQKYLLLIELDLYVVDSINPFQVLLHVKGA